MPFSRVSDNTLVLTNSLVFNPLTLDIYSLFVLRVDDTIPFEVLGDGILRSLGVLPWSTLDSLVGLTFPVSTETVRRDSLSGLFPCHVDYLSTDFLRPSWRNQANVTVVPYRHRPVKHSFSLNKDKTLRSFRSSYYCGRVTLSVGYVFRSVPILFSLMRIG